MRQNKWSILWGTTLALAVVGCSNNSSPRALKEAQQSETSGIPDSALKSTYLYLKSITDLRYAGKNHQDSPAGSYLDNDKLVVFQVKGDALNVVQVEPKLSAKGKENPIVASFPIHRKVSGGIEVDLLKDPGDSFAKDAVTSEVLQGLTVDPTNGAISFTTERLLNDDTVIDQRYSFLPVDANSKFKPVAYPHAEQNRFGFFKTSVYEADKYDRITQANLHEYLNHWDTSKTITYYLSKDFPTRLEPTVDEVFKAWNAVFKKATGKEPLRWERNSGQEPGDLRYSMIVYFNEPTNDGVLGYGPQWANPLTGEIVKGDVFLFGGTLRQELFSERVWAKQLGVEAAAGDASGAIPGKGRKPFLSMLPSAQLDTELLGQFSQTYAADHKNPVDLTAMIRNERMANDTAAARQTTRLDLAARIDLARKSGDLSDEELEKRIFQPVLAHELGHTFGLRHNFEASADAARFPEKASTTSEMDYPLVGSEDPGKPGPYDEAAIAYGYSTDAKVRTGALDQNFLFCTDQDLNDPDNALCNQHDTGTNLAEIVKGEATLYQTSYVFNNHRMDRVTFTANADAYKKAIFSRLLPIRVAYENADSILAATSYASLWKVTGQRIEKDAKSDAANVVAVKLKLPDQYEINGKEVKITSPTVTRFIDKSKVQAVVKDAQQAKKLAYIALQQIVLDRSRSESGQADINGDLQVRGVLADKLVALTLLTAPLGGSTPYESMDNGGGHVLLQALISGTTPKRSAKQGEYVHSPTVFNANLRAVALDGLATQLIKPGPTVDAREQLHLEVVPLSQNVLTKTAQLQKQVADASQSLLETAVPTSTLAGAFPGLAMPVGLTSLPNQVALSQAKEDQKKFLDSLPYDTRAELATYLETFMNRVDLLPEVAQGLQFEMIGLPQDETIQKIVNEQQLALDMGRDTATVAYTTQDNQLLKAPSTDTAAGLLVRDNINVWEDRLLAASALVSDLQAKFLEEKAKPKPDQKQMAQIAESAKDLGELIGGITTVVGNEKMFAAKMLRYYQSYGQK